MQTVTGRLYEGEKATLPGYAAYRVKDAEYPGIVPSNKGKTEGTLYSGLTDDDLKVLDAFEGAYYKRHAVEVHLRGGPITTAWVYVIRKEYERVLSNEPWHLDRFLNEGLRSFMDGYVHARKGVYAPQKQNP
jgi:gamma-glutamylcyclotransferase (GGCT)/AIG2-like uncharacterized protein YtfP